ncbi:unnamed protein product, partial [Mesorhabditis belari]|uniref:Protein kinase domain-containing protein n=1 Tax=Mesorhabditis belari TaxID=2138241 RepID=A0AAF3ESH2_9BILA
MGELAVLDPGKKINQFNVLDFGMCRKFVHDDGHDGCDKEPRTVSGFRSTVKYVPVACHRSREQCRLDDCEARLYLLVELTRGTLPWRKMKDIKEIGEEKRSVWMSDLGMKQLFGGYPREYSLTF